MNHETNPEYYIDISELDKAEVLAALVSNAESPLSLNKTEWPVEEARRYIADGHGSRGGLYFDYVNNRCIKCSLAEPQMFTWLYDRDNGEGAAAEAIKPLLARVEKDKYLKSLWKEALK